MVDSQLDAWKNKDTIIRTTALTSRQEDNIFQKCLNEVESMNRDIKIDKEKIISTFLTEKERKIKKKI